MNSPASSPGSISRPENMARTIIFYRIDGCEKESYESGCGRYKIFNSGVWYGYNKPFDVYFFGRLVARGFSKSEAEAYANDHHSGME